ncbi:hypothetical protein [Terracidiphilus sp.]|jgi:hypothetical protein|uniref:hypothetical protein n=1 Tax=Terracidiphilus sp. TaxID=1964191 RepID=UPI003C197F88
MATNPIKPDEEQPSDRFNQIGPNVSPKHRAILEAALAKNDGDAFYRLLASMPNVGLDSDFDRHAK